MDADDLAAFSARSAALGGTLWPAVVLIAGVEYAATVPTPRMMDGLVDGGEVLEGELVARIALTALATEPAEQQPLRWKRTGEAGWRAEKWWISNVRRSPLDQEWVVTCVPKN